jgi:threonine dehydrogenase-like Zn-dependent dehydrogenase
MYLLRLEIQERICGEMILESKLLIGDTGHENMGVVIETGSGVSLLKKGDRVVMPFNVADGRCRNCEEGRTAFCTGVNPYIPPFLTSLASYLHLTHLSRA